MTQDAKDTIELMKGPTTRARAKKMEGVFNAFMERTFKDVNWEKIEDLEVCLEASQLFLTFIVQENDQNSTWRKHGQLAPTLAAGNSEILIRF